MEGVIFTARKRSLRRLCFTPVCQSFCSSGGRRYFYRTAVCEGMHGSSRGGGVGGHAWQGGHVWQGACMTGGLWVVGAMDGRGWMHGRGCVWQGACMAGGMHGGGHAWQGACEGGGHVKQGACMAGGHAWQGVHGRGACMVGGRAWQILRDMVNERAVRILLECILVHISYAAMGTEVLLLIF